MHADLKKKFTNFIEKISMEIKKYKKFGKNRMESFRFQRKTSVWEFAFWYINNIIQEKYGFGSLIVHWNFGYSLYLIIHCDFISNFPIYGGFNLSQPCKKNDENKILAKSSENTKWNSIMLAVWEKIFNYLKNITNSIKLAYYHSCK